MLDMTREDLDHLSDAEFEELERKTDRLISIWQIRNLRGQTAVFHDDQHIGQKRRELEAVRHPSVTPEVLEKRREFRMKAVVDSLEGNTLIHPLLSPVIELNASHTAARALWWSIGVEGLSKFRETPTAIISLGMVPAVCVREDGEWKNLAGGWQRTTKNEYHAGWVRSMIPTNTRPPLTPEEDRNFLGRYAYRKDEVRKPVPEPPHEDTFETIPDETSMDWMYLNLK